MTATQIVLLVLAVLGLQVVIWVPLLLWMRKRGETTLEEVRLHVTSTGESITKGPDHGSYESGSGEFSAVSGAGVLVLTEKRLLFRKIIGADVEIPIERIKAVREEKTFRGSYRGGKLFLVIDTKNDDEVGFVVADHPSWLETLRGVVEA